MANSGQQNNTIDKIDDLFEMVGFMNTHGIDGKGLKTLEELKKRAKQELSERTKTRSLSAGKVWTLTY